MWLFGIELFEAAREIVGEIVGEVVEEVGEVVGKAVVGVAVVAVVEVAVEVAVEAAVEAVVEVVGVELEADAFEADEVLEIVGFVGVPGSVPKVVTLAEEVQLPVDQFPSTRSLEVGASEVVGRVLGIAETLVDHGTLDKSGVAQFPVVNPLTARPPEFAAVSGVVQVAVQPLMSLSCGTDILGTAESGKLESADVIAVLQMPTR
ncbi:hypothetical protein BGZ80_011270 [Entomortierella chlamydospora]|uniref:Uncharacterized protein n=1 Tax=Entomortierella chlamydospora TaxID=101097 RepID=A0A9P6SZ54_9FUNG|nr:hypothetical protein BGZ80_011270 [Entomortierella chlamydospora]